MRKVKDKVFAKPIEKQFEFDEDVAAVFDDMLSRSVPFYKEVQEIVKHFTCKHIEEGSIIYDLGCSTASTLLNIERDCKGLGARFIGLDNSKAMLEQAQRKIDIFNSKIELFEGDILTIWRESNTYTKHMELNFVLKNGGAPHEFNILNYSSKRKASWTVQIVFEAY